MAHSWPVPWPSYARCAAALERRHSQASSPRSRGARVQQQGFPALSLRHKLQSHTKTVGALGALKALTGWFVATLENDIGVRVATDRRATANLAFESNTIASSQRGAACAATQGRW